MKIKKKINMSQFAVFAALVVLVIFFAIRANNFISFKNIINILRQVSMYGICAVGMSMVIMTNGVDLSMSSTMGLVSVVSVEMMHAGQPIWLIILVSAVCGAIIGAMNGMWVSEVGMFPMIATMGMQILVRGIALIITSGMPLYNLYPEFLLIGQGYCGVIPVPVIIMLVLFVLGIFLLSRTVYGHQIYAVGGNQEAARLAGISYKAVRYKAYIIAGVCAAIAGLVYTARTNSGQPTAGTGFESYIIPACVLGGVRLGGGEGKLLGVLVGVLFMGVLNNGMILLNVNQFWQTFAQGSVLLLAVTFDRLTKEGSLRVKAKATTVS